MKPQAWVIGAGNWGKNHVSTLYSMGALAGVVDSDLQRLKSIHRDYAGIQTSQTLDFEKMKGSPVVVATPVAFHYSLTHDLLSAGFDVLVEKPMAMTSAQAGDLARLAHKCNRILMVGHLLLYQPAIHKIRETLQNNRMGTLYSIHMERLNFGTVRSVENALWSLGVHDIAVLISLVGAVPQKVSAFGSAHLQPGIEDDCYAHLEFGNGVSASLHVSWLWPHKRRQMTILGSTGMLVYDEVAQRVTLHRKRVGADFMLIDEGEELLVDGPSDPLRLELEDFIRSTVHRTPPIADASNGYKTLQVMEMAMASRETTQ